MIVALAGSLAVLLPTLQQTVFANGEQFIYNSDGDSMQVSGGIVTGTANLGVVLTSTIGGGFTCGIDADPPVCYVGDITIKGSASRIPPAPGRPGVPVPPVSDADTCTYGFAIYPVANGVNTNPPRLSPGQTGIQIKSIDFDDGGAKRQSPGGVGACKDGETVEKLMTSPSLIQAVNAATITASAQCASKGGVYDLTAKTCTLPTCGDINGVGGVFDINTKQCAYIKASFPGGVCPADTKEGTYTGQNGVQAAACFGAATAVPGADTAGQDPDVCPLPANATFRWASCWLIDGFNSLLKLLDSVVTTFLTIDTSQIFGTSGTINDPGAQNNDTSKGFYKAWGVFRNLGIGVVVIAAIIMVMSELLGLQIVDALTIRRLLPKIGVVVILIAISWPLMYYLITASNRIGHGMASLIYSSFDGVGVGDNGQNAVSGVLTNLLVAGGALAAFGFLGLLSFAATLAISMILAFFMLLVREGIIIMAVIIAPLALACYVLPNTSKFTNFWWGTFFKSLLAFPIVTGFIAICKVMAIVSKNL